MNHTLDDSQQDDNDKEEESDVKDHTVELVFIPCWVFDFISNAAAGADANIHVEQVTLWERAIPM